MSSYRKVSADGSDYVRCPALSKAYVAVRQMLADILLQDSGKVDIVSFI